MTDKSGYWDTLKVDGAAIAAIADKLKEIIHEGNVRRVVVEHDGRTVAEFPLTAGVLGVVLAPVLAAIAALAALLKDCTVHVERGAPTKDPGAADTDTDAPASPPR